MSADCKPEATGNQSEGSPLPAADGQGLESRGSEQEVEGSGEEPPDELPLAGGDGVSGGEEIHQSEEQPDGGRRDAETAAAPPGRYSPYRSKRHPPSSCLAEQPKRAIRRRGLNFLDAFGARVSRGIHELGYLVTGHILGRRRRQQLVQDLRILGHGV